MHAKLIDGELIIAPKTITKHYNPYPIEMMEEDGYKKVIRNDPPEVPEDSHLEGHYEEREDCIEFVWEIVPGPSPEVDE